MAFIPVGAHQTDSTISSATTIDPPAGLAKGPARLLIQALTQNVRMTLDGTTPTASVGFRLVAGDPPIMIAVTPPMTVKVIEETASGAVQFQWGAE